MTEYGVNYGDVRDFIINKGVADLFAVGGQIVNPVERVIPLLNFLRSKKFFKSENDSPLADFISAFFSFNRIFGFDWKKVSWDKPAQAGFAQSFLEYIANVVIPLWNNTEVFLSRWISSGQSDDQLSKFAKPLKALLKAMQPSEIFGWLAEHLRFPKMKIRVVDYPNAHGGDFQKLGTFRLAEGIPPKHKKKGILDAWAGLWDKIPELKDENLNKGIDLIGKQIKAAAYEAKYTGDFTYFRQLQKYQLALVNEKVRRDRIAAGDTIVSSSISVQPLLSPAQEEEKKR